jgi:hypothetical protein
LLHFGYAAIEFPCLSPIAVLSLVLIHFCGARCGFRVRDVRAAGIEFNELSTDMPCTGGSPRGHRDHFSPRSKSSH